MMMNFFNNFWMFYFQTFSLFFEPTIQDPNPPRPYPPRPRPPGPPLPPGPRPTPPTTPSLQSPCPFDWITYMNVKCIKILPKTMQTFNSAKQTCSQFDATLLMIHSQEEQTFMVDLLFKTQFIVDNIWLGARVTETADFAWIDSSNFDYQNWSSSGPRRKASYCIEMLSDESNLGRWLDVPCEKNNVVVCQKAQNFGPPDDDDDDGRKYWIPFIEEILLVRETMRETQNRIDALEKNPVPRGFIYTQYPGQPSPGSLWPKVTFQDVSSQYAGRFFRAEGGSAASFGQNQEENCPRLVAVFGEHSYETKPKIGQVDMPSAGWSENVFSGYEPESGQGQGWALMRFKSSGGEVRPANMAVKIWKRK